VPAKIIKLVGLTRPPFLTPTNLITFAGTQNGEYKFFLCIKTNHQKSLNISLRILKEMLLGTF
jgi:hypothetical protein